MVAIGVCKESPSPHTYRWFVGGVTVPLAEEGFTNLVISGDCFIIVEMEKYRSQTLKM
jgi:hypothetical protein